MPVEAFAAPATELPRLSNQVNNKNRRRSAPVLSSLKRLAEETQVYIFNVGPWSQPIMKGTWRYFIPGCAEGERVSAPVVIPGIVTEEYPDSEKTMKLLQYDGYDFALDLIGIGIAMDPAQSLARYGVFVSRTEPPSEAEIDEARARLDIELNGLIAEANGAWSEGPTVFRKTVGTKGHHWDAARLLRKNAAECPWLGNKTAAGNRIACPFCGTSMESNLPKCPNCKEIVNQAAYKAAQAAARQQPESTT